jgi:hypothetical protein
MTGDTGSGDSSEVADFRELAAAQRRLVECLVTGGPVPAGFDSVRVAVAARALLNKRAGEVARVWPRLAASHGPDWPGVFRRWAEGRPPRGPWRDGWDLARAVRDRLDPAAVLELAEREARWSYDGATEPRRRSLGVRRIPRGVVVQAFGRLVTLGGRGWGSISA